MFPASNHFPERPARWPIIAESNLLTEGKILITREIYLPACHFNYS